MKKSDVELGYAEPYVSEHNLIERIIDTWQNDRSHFVMISILGFGALVCCLWIGYLLYTGH